MRALYLYFAETPNPGRRPSSATGAGRAADDEPLTPIRPGAFSRWMANRERAAGEAAATSHAAVIDSPVRRGQDPEAAS